FFIQHGAPIPDITPFQSLTFSATSPTRTFNVALNSDRTFTLSAVPQPAKGDFNGDGIVDAQDYNIWRADFGTNNAAADGNEDGVVNLGDYVVWRNHLAPASGSGASQIAAVPEPAIAAYLVLGAVSLLQSFRRDLRDRKAT